jgi:hypothetical protein
MGDIEDFTISDGVAYAVVADCNGTGCSNVHLERSVASTSTNTWTTTELPGVQSSPAASITSVGGQVWIHAQTGGGQEVLLHSNDSGVSFTSGPSPCSAGLGGTVQAVSDSVLWLVCPTGTEAQALRSTDGGASFQGLNTGEIVNSTQMAAADPLTAALVGGASSGIRRTADGGATFQTVFSPSPSALWLYVGFTTPTVGVGLSTGGGSTLPDIPATSLWRTTDAGLTWHPVTY